MLQRVVVVVVMVLLAEGVCQGAAHAVVTQQPHQRMAFTGWDAVAGEGGGGSGGV